MGSMLRSDSKSEIEVKKVKEAFNKKKLFLNCKDMETGEVLYVEFGFWDVTRRRKRMIYRSIYVYSSFGLDLDRA